MRLFFLIFAVTLLASVQPVFAQSEDNPAADEGVQSAIKLLDAWIARQRLELEIPSISIGVMHGQTMVWAKSYGYQDPESNIAASPQTVYRIASNSKLFTSVSLMKLQEEGKLSLYDPVIKWLPEFAALKNEFTEARPIMIWHLITHTSGLPRESNSPFWTERNFPSVAEIFDGLKGQQAIIPTDKRFKYSNLALALAGEIVARAAGMPYDDYVQQNIFDPLGMALTGADALTDSAAANLAKGYSREFPDRPREVQGYDLTHGMASATGLYTSVEDFSKFIRWQLRLRENGGTEILNHNSLKEMQRIHWLNPSWNSGWGLGFSIRKVDGGRFVGHGGAIHGYRTNTGIIPEDNVGIIVFTSADDGNPTRYVNKIIDVLVPAIRNATKKKPEELTVPAHWQKLVGTYRSDFGESEVLILNKKLVVMNPLGDNLSMKNLTRLIPISDYEFQVEIEAGGREPDEIARFTLDENGNVERFYRGVNYSKRIN